MEKYILDEASNPVVEPNTLKWVKWFESQKRHVALDTLPDGTRVSTIFLGLDHSWNDGPPVLWETMIFGGEHDGYQDRYTSKADALAGHATAVALATKSLGTRKLRAEE